MFTGSSLETCTGKLFTDRRPGHMRIWTLDGQLFEIRAKNTLLRREEELSYTAVTKLSFDPTRDGEQAGLTCYYSTATYARFSLCFEGGRKLQLVINRSHGEELIAEVDQIKKWTDLVKSRGRSSDKTLFIQLRRRRLERGRRIKRLHLPVR